MPAKILDGKALAARMRGELAEERKLLGSDPIRLLSIEVGEHPAAAVYLRGQRRAAEQVGIQMESVVLPRDTDEPGLIARIQECNEDPTVAGILIQRPLPIGIDARRIQAKVHPDKDVEGMNPANMGGILYREPMLVPCTAAAAQALVQASGIELRGAEVVVVGHSEIVGKPIAILLLHHLATVTVCHVGTKNLTEHTRRADILVVAVGKAGLIHGDMIRPGCVVIDIGINATDDGKVVGDVDHDSAMATAGHLTPVPGGVGPVTVAMLMRNTLRAANHLRS